MGGHNIYIPAPACLYSYTFTVYVPDSSSYAIHKFTATGNVKVFWGDGTSTVYTDHDGFVSHTYSSSGTYEITICHSNNISAVESNINLGCYIIWDISDGNFPQSSTYFYNDPRSTLTGNWTDFPDTMVTLDMSQQRTGSSIVGDVTDLPSSLEYFEIAGNFKINGDLADLPSGVTHYDNNSSPTTSLTGDTAFIPSGMTYFRQNGGNTMYGDVVDLPNSITYLSILGSNTVEGDVSDLPSNLTYIFLSGNNTLTGDTSDFPSGTSEVRIWGNNTIYGGLDVNSNITHLSIDGNNTINDDIANLTTSVTTLSIIGNNTVYGNLSSLSGLTFTHFTIEGSNTITGDIVYLQSISINIKGSNTISGDTSDVYSSCTTLTLAGNNTLTGDVANLSNVNRVGIEGSNTIYGDIADIPAKAVYYVWYIYGNNTISGDLADLVHPSIVINPNRIEDYSGKTWSGTWSRLEIPSETGYGLSASEVDNLLIDMADDLTSWYGAKTIDLRGGHAARTSTSDAAVLTLQGRGVSVNTN